MLSFSGRMVLINTLFSMIQVVVMKTKTIKFNVKGMHCKSCEMLLKDILEEQKGVKKAYFNSKSGAAKIEFDETQINENKIKSLIKNEGYKTD